jgi:hypothetical protein
MLGNSQGSDRVTGQPATPEQEKKAGAVKRTFGAARSIATDPAGTASLIALLIGIIMTFVSFTGVQAVGYALIGGAFFSFIYQFWANDALVKMITSKVDEEVGGQWRQLAAETIVMHKRHWPVRIFPEGSTPNEEFNRQMELDLNRAFRYDFRGQSGKHTASRLLKSYYSHLSAVRIIVEDVTIEQVMNARIDEKRFGEPGRLENLSDERLREIVLSDMFDSLVGFHLLGSRIDSVELVYAGRPTNVRIEIVDGTVYSSPFVRNRPRGYKYPEVFCYDLQSVPAQVAVLEFDREFGLLSDSKVRFDSSMSRERLREHLEVKGWDLSRDEFNRRYREAEQSLSVVGDALG